MSTIGERIKTARVSAGITQTELASKIGVKYSAIHKYEAGLVVNLKRGTIDSLAQALNVKPSYLLCIDDDEKPAIGNDSGLTDEEKRFLEKFRAASEDKRQAAEYVLGLK